MAIHEHVNHALDQAAAGRERLLRRGRWVFCMFAIIASLYLISEHRAHFLGALPFLVILACPLLHMFMHRGHGGHGGHAGPADGQPPPGKLRDWKQ